MSEMCHMTNSPVRQGAPEAERREKGGQLENDRQIVRAHHQRGVVLMRPTHALGKQSG